MSRRRVVLFLLLAVSITVFLIEKGKWTEDAQLVFGGWILLCAALFFFAPAAKSKARSVRTTSSSVRW